MIPSGPDIALRAVGAALAGVSIVFAGYMLTVGAGEVRVFGMEHLGLFAKPRGIVRVAAPPISPLTPVDMATTGSLGNPTPKAAPWQPIAIVAARADRVWLRVDGKIVAAVPGDSVLGLGRIGAIMARDNGWAVVDEKGATLLTLARRSNGASLFSHKLIFD